MNGLTKSRLLGYLALLFVVGGLTGAVLGWRSASISNPFGSRPSHPPPSMKSVAEYMRSRYQDRLELTPAQMQKITPTLDRAAQEMEKCHRRTLEEVEEIIREANKEIVPELTAEQQAKFEVMEKERCDFMSRKGHGRSPQRR